MIDDFAKTCLHKELRAVRQQVVAKLDDVAVYDVRRPLTRTGTNLLGLIKHLATWESRYLGEVFGRPFPEALPRWDDAARASDNLWATEDETRNEIIDLYRRVWVRADDTIRALDLDAPGHVPWWPHPTVNLFSVLVHQIAETNRHARHADIVREHLDGSGSEETLWDEYRRKIDNAALNATRSQH